MGEYADDEFDRYFNEWTDYSDIDPFDDAFDFDDGRDIIFVRTKICKYCGKHGLRWVWTEVGWRLFDSVINSLHSCIERIKVDFPNE